MNCDEVFDLLTSPMGSGCEPLRDHLEHCPRCRDLQEAIAPALAAFDEPARPAPWEQKESAESAAARLNLVHCSRRSRAWTNQLWKYVGIFLFGGTMVGLAFVFLAPSPAVALPAETCLWVSRDQSETPDHHVPRDVVLTCVQCHLGK